MVRALCRPSVSSEAEKPKPPKDSLALHRLLEKQYYRLAYWRVASDEINYRRFFEITDLAGLRTEDPDAFAATHAFVARLARRGGIEGLRIDHPDGLADPRQYFERLARLFPRRWIVVEKILAEHEKLPGDWPVHGETGYRFANLLTGLFIDAAAESRFDRIYRRFTGERRTFEEIARQSRILIMATTLYAELARCPTGLRASPRATATRVTTPPVCCSRRSSRSPHSFPYTGPTFRRAACRKTTGV